MYVKRSLTIIFILLLPTLALSQTNYQSDYLSGKSFFRQGEYLRAKNYFAKVLNPTDKNPFYLYANYFYGISAYESGDVESGITTFTALDQEFPKWDKAKEVDIWLGKMLIEQGRLLKSLSLLNAFDSEPFSSIAYKIKKKYLRQYDSISLLKRGLELNPYDSVLANYLADKIQGKPVNERETELLEFIIDAFDLNKAEYDLFDSSVSQIKDTYNVAVMLPFMEDNLSTDAGNKGNQFVLDMYNGILQAADELNKDSVKIELFAFDTKKDSLTTHNILASGDLLEMDLIIGPLYSESGELVRPYAEENKINIINPLSTNGALIGENPYSFLLKSTAETFAKKAADFAIKNYTYKKATIYYGSSNFDSIYAHTYKAILEEDSFDIRWIEPIRNSTESMSVLRKLTATYNEDGELDDRKYKVRVGDDDELYYTSDSIGHVLVASADNITVASVLSGLNARRDSIPVIGLEEWIELKQISFSQIERLNVMMLSQNYLEYSEENFIKFKEDYLSRYNKLPTQFSIDGYESMRFFGSQLIEYGNYFQYGLKKAGLKTGFLYKAFDYSTSNDNSYVPILKLIDQRLNILIGREEGELIFEILNQTENEEIEE